MSHPSQGKPDVDIGKRGLTEGAIQSIKEKLQKKNILKVKVLKNAIGPERDVKYYMNTLAKQLGAKSKDKRGNTFLIEKI